MFRVTSDATKNRLHITLAGYLEGPERQEALKAIMAEAGKLAPGSDVINDISALHASNKEGFKDLLRAKSALKLKGVGHIIRVVKIPLSHMQIERISKAAGYEADSAESIEEADRRLDAPSQEDGGIVKGPRGRLATPCPFQRITLDGPSPFRVGNPVEWRPLAP